MNALPAVREDLLDHRPILYAGDDPKRPAAAAAALDIDAENAPEALCPADRGAPLGLDRLLRPFPGAAALAAGAATGRGHAHPEGMKAR